MKKYIQASIVLAFLAGVSACNHPADQTAARSFIETANIDSSVRPGDNFFLFVNGRWLKTAEIPATESRIGVGLEVFNRTKANVKSILDSVSSNKQTPGSIEQKVGDFYASGMDSTTIEKLGYDPVKPLLQEIDSIKDVQGILKFETERQKEGFSYIIASYVGADQKNSAINIVNVFQTGLGLPDRDYYFKTDPATVAVQQSYKNYIETIFKLTGDDASTAAAKCSEVYNLEKEIAESHRTNVELRDPQSNYHKMAVTDLAKKTPTIEWQMLLDQMGIKIDSLNVGQLAYYSKLNELLKTAPLTAWKAYYRFHVLDDASDALSSPFVNAHFEYATKTLSGQQQIKPRWERIYSATDANLGEALGQLYVQRYFSADAKKRMEELVSNLQKSFESRINALDWMSDSTKQIAKTKLYAFLKKIGYPDKWKDYSKVAIYRKKYYDNRIACSKNARDWQVAKIGRPVDKTEWGMTPPTINAYYNPTFNEIVFPAGILQFPFFDASADDAVNYGGIGMVIGHEMTHGFDDQGSQFDKDGNLKNWWGVNDRTKFVAKTKSVIDLYNGFTVLDSLHVNGALTTGENIADIGGLAIAYNAFKLTKEGQDTTKIDGFTPDQRFFIGYAQIWRSKLKDAAIRQRVNGDPHSPAMYRVNGPLENFTPFYNAFNVQPSDKMFRPDSARIKIW